MTCWNIIVHLIVKLIFQPIIILHFSSTHFRVIVLGEKSLAIRNVTAIIFCIQRFSSLTGYIIFCVYRPEINKILYIKERYKILYKMIYNSILYPI